MLGVVLAGLSVTAIELQNSFAPGTDLGWHDVEGYLWAIGLGLVLCVRRAFPLSVLVASTLLFFGIGQRLPGLGISLFVQISLFMALYAAWAWSRYRTRLYWLSGAVVVSMFAWVIQQFADQNPLAGAQKTGLFDPTVAIVVYQLGVNVIYFFGAIAWGLVSWRADRRRETLREQTEKLRHEQEENARRAVADERVRIARDLHDVVAHHVSSIGVHAAGARRMLDRDPESSAGALRTIEDSSRTAVAEMHQLVGLLRSASDGSDSDRSPRPGLGELADLVRSSTDERLRVELKTVGARFDVADTVGLSIYRTTQEALSNVRQHSTAKDVSVTLRYLELPEGRQAMEIEIIDDGKPRQRSGADREGGGWGLKGIEERASMHGGESEIGPRPSGGFRVRLRLPVGTPA